MLDFDVALQEILKHTPRLSVVKVPISHSLGYVLAEQVKAREAIPLFDSSSVDGFAVRVQDIREASKENPIRLLLQGTISAGNAARSSLKPQHAIKIMTGALVPKISNAVVMKEFVAVDGEEILFASPAKEGENIRRRGEEFNKGEIVFFPGTFITPPIVGLLATLGFASIRVYRKPKVAVIVTGNELRSPSVKLRSGQIRDSNSYMLSAVLQAHGIEPILVLHSRDSEKEISKVFSRALKKADVIISAGGVSVGEFDFVKEVLASLNVKTVFWKVAMKPGKPNFFGTKGKQLIFGLPGNPVSALVSFEMLVMPALRKMMGIQNDESLILTANIQTDLKKKAGRVDFVRAVVSRNPDGQLIVTPASGQGSHMVGGLAAANCLIIFPKESEHFSKGESVAVRMLSWN